jgi:hypothetical protein
MLDAELAKQMKLTKLSASNGWVPTSHDKETNGKDSVSSATGRYREADFPLLNPVSRD